MNRKFTVLFLLFLSTFSVAFTADGNNNPFFIENKGQWHSDVRYLAILPSVNAWITQFGVVYDYYQTEKESICIFDADSIPMPGYRKYIDKYTVKGHVVRESLLPDNSITICQGINKRDTYFNYFLGNDPRKWASNVGLYNEIRVIDIQNKIEIRYYFEGNNLRYDYILQPGADLTQLKMKFEGSDGLYITESGELAIKTCFGNIHHGNLLAYQIVSQRDTNRINCNFVFNTDGSIGFRSENYNPNLALVIDPLVWSTYIGGNDRDGFISYLQFNHKLVIDQYDNSYITGRTHSRNYPITPGAYQGSKNSYGMDAVITKIKADGTNLIFSTFFGGKNDEDYCSVRLDNLGNIVLFGHTEAIDLPITANAVQISCKGFFDLFAAKLDSNGSSLLYSTYLGGQNNEVSAVSAVDNVGNIYIAGLTLSPDFPHTHNFGIPARGNYIAKLDINSSTLGFATRFDGVIHDMLFDRSGNLVLTGYINGFSGIVTPESFQGNPVGGFEGFISVINPEATSVLRGTYVASNGTDFISSIAMDRFGNFYVTGKTDSATFPVTPNAFDTTFNRKGDVFIAKLTSDLTNLVYGTYIGGSEDEEACGIGVSGKCEAYVTGYTLSQNFPMKLPISNIFEKREAFLCRLDSAGSRLMFSSYLGGSEEEQATGLAVNYEGDCFVTGLTLSKNFPVTEKAYDTSYNDTDGEDIFVLRMGIGPSLKAADLDFRTIVCESSLLDTVWVYNKSAVSVSITSSSFSGKNAGEFSRISPKTFQKRLVKNDSIAFIIKFTPANEGKKIAFLNIDYDLADEPLVVTLTAKKDSIAFEYSGLANDTLKFEDICRFGAATDTAFTIINKSTIPTTLTCDTVNFPFEFAMPKPFPLSLDTNERKRISFRLLSTADTGVVVQPFVLTDTCGRTKILYLKIYINPLPEPVISGMTDVCTKNPFDYAASPIEGYSNKWKIIGGTPATSFGNNITITWGTPGSGTITLIQTQNITGCVDSVMLPVTIHELPKMTIKGVDTVCGKNYSSYNSTSPADCAFKWKIKGGKIDNDSLSLVEVLWDSSGVGKLTLIQTNLITGCTDSTFKTVKILPLPIPRIAGIDTVCEGNSSTYSTNSTGLFSSWEIIGGKPKKYIGDKPTILWENAGTGMIILTQKNYLTGCIDSVRKEITILPVPNPTIKGQLTACLEKYKYKSDSDSNVVSHWSITGGLPAIALGDSIEILWNEAGDNPLKLVQTNKFTGCTDSIIVIVSVGSSLKPKIIHNRFLCKFSTMTLSADSDYKIYRWSTGDSTKEISISKPGKFRLFVKDDYGCEGWSDTVEVIEMPLPVPEIELTGGPLCVGKSAQLSVKSDYAEYLWSTGESTREITVKESYIYKVTVTDSNGCKGTSAEFSVYFNRLPIVELTGPKIACLGSTVKYSTMSQDDCIIKWNAEGGEIQSDDISEVVTVIWNNYGKCKISCSQIDTVKNCEGVASMEVIAGKDIKPTINGNPALCSGLSTTLYTDGDYTEIKWNTGATTNEISVTQNGKYWYWAKVASGCEGWSDTVEVIEYPEFNVEIEGKAEICEGETTTLQTDKEFSAYKWSTGAKTRQIEVSEAGIYEVEVTDENGCKAIAEIEVKTIEIVMADTDDINFGECRVDTDCLINKIYKNSGNEPFRIKSVSIKGDDVFKFINTPPTNQVLAPNGELSLEIKFSPKQNRNYSATITIVIDEPCPKTVETVVRGIGSGISGSATVWLPDTTANVGNTYFCIPIFARLKTDESVSDLSFTAEIRFQADAMKTTNPSLFTIQNNDRIIKVTGNIDKLTDRTTQIGMFCGDVLLADKTLIPLYLEKVEWNTAIQTQTIDGSLKLLYCQLNLAAVKLFKSTQISMKPNPAESEVNISISSEETGQFSLEIYSVAGLLLDKKTWSSSGNQNSQFRIDLSQYAVGMYQVVLNSPGGIKAKQLIVVN